MKSNRLDWDVLNSFSMQLIEDKENYNDYILGVYIQIALRSALRVSDILAIKKTDFDFKEKVCTITTMKTNKKFSFSLPDWLLSEIESIEVPSTDGNLKATKDKLYCIFYNKKYGSIYSRAWVNNRLKKKFGSDGVSSHSIRKSAGLKMYEKYGVNGASSFLTHSSLQHTKIYLELDERETLKLQQQAFA